MTIQIVQRPIPLRDLVTIAESQFGNLVKAVVDIDREVMAIGGELHADGEAELIADSSHQEHLWGINLYPGKYGGDWIGFDSMINVRPSQGNSSRDVEDATIRERIHAVVQKLIT